MNKWLFLLVVLVIVSLTSCSNIRDDQLDIDNTPSISDEQISNGLEPFTPSIHFNNEVAVVKMDYWCLEEDDAPCNNDDKLANELLQGVSPLKIGEGDVFEVWWGKDAGSKYDERIYMPDLIEVTQTRLKEQTKVEVNNDLNTPTEIAAPTEKGKYYYSIWLKYDSELVGEAHYVFSIAVQ